MQLRSVTPLVFSVSKFQLCNGAQRSLHNRWIYHHARCDKMEHSILFFSPFLNTTKSQGKKKKKKSNYWSVIFSKALSVFLSHHPQNLMIKLLLISMAAVMLIPTTPGHAMLKCICDMCFLFSWSYLAPIDSFLLSLCFPVFWFSSQ